MKQKLPLNNFIKSVFITLLFLISNSAIAQIPIFSNPSEIIGTDKTKGAKYLYKDVTTTSGVGVDAVVTVVDIVNATIITIDNPTNGGLINRFQPEIKSTRSGGYVEFEFAFFKAGTYGTAGQLEVELESFPLEALDVDGTEFFDVARPNNESYFLESNTLITVTPGTPYTRFQGPNQSANLINLNDTEYIAVVYFKNLSSVKFRLGSNSVNNGTAGNRQSSISFGEVVFNVPVAPNANNDFSFCNTLKSAASIDVTINDTDLNNNIDKSSVDLIPSTAVIDKTYVVANQGTWTVNNSGIVTFTPLAAFTGNPTPITYKIYDTTLLSDSATITITYKPTATIEGTTTLCKDATATKITFTATGGNAPYTFTYKINNGSEQKVTTTSGNSVSVSAPTSTANQFVYTLISVGDGSSNSCINPQSGNATVTVNPKASASDITTANQTICTTEKATVTATSSIAGATFKWYSDAAQTTLLSSSASFTTPALTATTSYYVTVTGTATCENAANNAKVVTVTVNPKASASDITAANKTICTGEMAALSATSTIAGATFKWYSNAALTTLVNTGANFTTPTLTATTSYYVTVTGTSVCENTANAGKVVTVIVNPKASASDITAADKTICTGETAALSATSTIAGATFKWYSNAALTTLVYTGANFTTPTLTATTSYYVTVTGTATCENAANSGKVVTVTVNPKASASDITAADKTICTGETAALSATSTIAGATFKWYSNAALTTLVNTGANFTTPALTATTSYYVTVAGTSICENAATTAKVVTVTVNPKASASDITAANKTICTGETAALSATSTIVGATFKWYSNAALTTLVNTGANFTTPALTATTSYYVTVSGTATCENDANAGKVVTVTVNPKASASDITAANKTICTGETAALTATSTIAGATFKWYSNAALTTLVYTGANFTTPTLTATTSYYVTVTGTATCENSANSGKIVTVTVNPKASASDITAANKTICTGETAALSATSTIAGATFRWYSDAALKNLVYTGANFTTPTLTATTSYYVTVTGTSVCENTANAGKVVTVTVNPKASASDITAADKTICTGETAALSATSTIAGAIFKWYSNAALTTLVYTGANFTTPTLTATTSYYVTVTGTSTCENAANNAKVVTVTVNPKASASDITAADKTICTGETAALSATSTIAGATFKWYSNAALTTLVYTGANFTTPTLTATTSYYVTVTGTSTCENAANNAKVVTVTVNPKASASDITAANKTICTGETAALSATSTIAGATFKWYSNAALTNLVFTGANFTTPTLTATTSYYVTVTGTSVCENTANAGKVVTVTVNPKASASDITAADKTICTGETAALSATSTIAGATFKWYSNAALTTLVYTGANFTTPTLTATTSYYVTVTGTSVCENTANAGKVVTVIVNPKASASDITAADKTICTGETAALSATSTIAGATFKWYSNAALTNLVYTGATFTTTALTTTTSYYVTVTGTAVCENAANAGKVVTVTVNPKASASDITAANKTICTGETAALSATSTIAGATFKWYSNAALTTVVYTGANFTTPALTATTSYYVTVTGTATCENAANSGKVVTVTVNPKASASDITAADKTICTGETAALSATSTIAGATFKWYSNAALTTLVYTGANFTTPALTATTSYYVTVSGTATCENAANSGKVVTVTVNPKASASDITAADKTICTGETAALTATSTIAGATFRWYSDAALKNLVYTGATFTTTALTATTSYYVTVTGTATCENAANSGKVVTVTVNPKATASDITAANKTICTGETAALSATSTIAGATFKWYSNAALTTLVYTGANFTTPTLTATTSYYVTVTGTATCENAANSGKVVTVTVNPKASASDITAANKTICTGETAALSATSTIAGATFKWYSNAALTNLVFTGANFTTPTLTATTSYYVTVTGTSVCENTANAGKVVTVTVNPKASASDITAANKTICTGETAALSATSGIAGAVFKWYSDAALTNLVYTGATFTTTALTTTTSYYVTVTGSATCENATNSGKVVTVTVNPKASASDITAANKTICTGETAALTASSTITGATFRWYSDAALTNLVFTGANFITPALTATTSYYVTVTGTAVCENAANAGKVVTVTVNPKASASDITAADKTICTGETAALSATSTIAGAAFRWYSDAALKNLVYTGATFTTTALTATTSYYVTVTGTATCENAANAGKVVTVTVNLLPKATISGTTTVCKDVISPKVTFTGSNGTAPYTFVYKIGNGSNQSVTTTIGNSVTIDAPTTVAGQFVYSLVNVTDASSSICSQTQTGTVTITVDPLLQANNDIGSEVNGSIGGTSYANVLKNDTLDDQPVTSNQVIVTFVSSTNPNITLSGNNVMVAAGTPTGNYSLTYKICGTTTSCSCSTATVSVPVGSASIDALDDTFASASGIVGNSNIGNVLSSNPTSDNTPDTLNGLPTNINEVKISILTPAIPASTNAPVPTIDISTGNVSVPAGTIAGNYIIKYQICEILNSANCDFAFVTIPVYAPSISITKDGTYSDANNDGITNIGDLINYTFIVKNTGGSILTNVKVTDDKVAVTGGPIDLAIGQTDNSTFTAAYSITQDDINKGVVYNLALATGTPPVGPSVTATSTDPTPCTTCPVDPICLDCTMTPLEQKGAISITKDGTYQDTNADGVTNIGDLITYTFVVKNTGNVTLTNVTVTDDNATVIGGPIATLTVGATDTTTFTATHTLTQDDINKGIVYNLATVTGTDPKGNPTTATSTDPTPCTTCPVDPECIDCTMTPLDQKAAISITKDGMYQDTNADGVTNIGDLITYTFVVKNTGNVTLTNVTVTDDNATVIGGPIATLAVGAVDNTTFTATHTLTQDDINKGIVYNLATVTGTDPKGNPTTATSTDPTPCTTCPVDPTCLDCTITELDQQGAIALVKTGLFIDSNKDGFAQVGETIEYSFTVTNTGNVTLTNVIVTDPLLPNLTGSPINILLVGNSNNTIKGTYILTQADIDAGKVINTALAVGQDPKGTDVQDISGTTVNNNTNTVTPLPQSAALAVVKVANTPFYSSVGDVINYTIQVQNIGSVSLYNIVVTDPLTGLNETIPTLAPGTYQEYNVDYIITQQDRLNLEVINVAFANGFTPDNKPISASDTEVVEANIVEGCRSITAVDIHNAISPNGDNKNEVFIIDNIEDTLCYPTNSIEIYNRWGVLVYETKGYDNATNAFKGFSEGRTTISKSEGLPAGTYFYILNYTSLDGLNNSINNTIDGYLYLAR
ncbi:Ig-like domain-containing protein [Flavobacterium algicola]|uniref:Ig-like domain-containing protein n=1 Tax=Flavobacterium algicola TaxID=556529 RepID=UPI001EFCD389|nr:gliding motility-associated C-terminal domain-containing protein [Flavobacterium algicola]MCG9792645.1 gliding motility-associated C-terminal domain-containing protein [Flavobacterium algicola]